MIVHVCLYINKTNKPLSYGGKRFFVYFHFYHLMIQRMMLKEGVFIKKQKMKLMAVTDGTHDVGDLARKIIKIREYVDFIQIREKTKSVKDIMSLLSYLEEGGVEKEKIIMNDRLDVALLMDIPTIHLPESGLPVWKVKERYPQLKVGRSVHSLEIAKEAEREGADYLLYGHCFETNSKKGKTPNGLLPLMEIKKAVNIPVFAIGGITIDNFQLVQEAKADGIAVMSGIFSAQDSSLSAKQFFEAVNDEK